MDINKYLLLLKGEDKTASVSFVKSNGHFCAVTFRNSEHSFNYKMQDVQFFKLRGEISWIGKIIHINHKPVDNVDKVLDFGTYIRIIYTSGCQQVYSRSAISLVNDKLQEQGARQLFSYFTNLAKQLGLTNEDGESLLAKSYAGITKIPEGSILASYLDGSQPVDNSTKPAQLYYPFGINASQKRAVENALAAPISIIQGPPGTGKTQTILNIIANALIGKKTVAVVSNNNSATYNVVEKLAKKQLDFVAAFLGNKQNKQKFLAEQNGLYPQLQGWLLSSEQLLNLEVRIQQLTQELDQCLELQNQQAQLGQELAVLQTEEQHFASCYGAATPEGLQLLVHKFSSSQLLELWLLCEARLEQGSKLTLWQKLKLWFKYNRQAVQLVEQASVDTISALQQCFYMKKEAELQEERKHIVDGLQAFTLEEKIEQLTKLSLERLRHALALRYQGRKRRRVFIQQQLDNDSTSFLEEYPLVLSTTHSLRSCLNPNQLYDYVIVDEASQVDLLTGILALSCARNIIIVGDLKQLPNVITAQEQGIVAACSGQQLPDCYNFAKQSLLSSAVAVWPQAPSVLLREHYRCQPQIIDFCNQRFYQGQLIVMTKAEEGVVPLRLYKTSRGNHARGRMNQREADVISREILPSLLASGITDIGVVAPYRDQVQLLKRTLPSFCEIDTVHKFQGREKDVIILSSVDNELTDFVDDYHMLNVAVSRAVKSLIVVTSGNDQKLERNYTALARYIAYQHLEVVESKTHSVFDLLYKGYYQERKRFLSQHAQISEYDSENLFFALVEEVLAQEQFKALDCACHVPLYMLFSDLTGFSEEEQAFVQQPLAHTDFLLYRRVDKSPVLAVEVDGTSFHEEGSRQAARDQKKDHIFAVAGLPLLRLRTDGSNEEQRLVEFLTLILQS